MSKLKSKLKTMLSLFCFNFRISKLPYMPKVAIVELTNDCNYRCKFCPMNSENETIRRKVVREKTYMSFEDFKDIVDKYGHLIDDLGLASHGESLLHPEFEKFVKYLCEKGIDWNITTNGSLLDEKMAKTFIKYPPTQIILSLYSLNSERYEKLCVNGKLEVVLKNINYFLENRDKKTKVVIRTINMPQLQGEIEKFKSYFDKYDNIEYLFGVLNTWAGRVDISKYDSNLKNHKISNENNYCLQPWQHVIINSDTGVYLCNNDDDTPMGYLNKTDLKKIWNSKEYIQVRKNILNGRLTDNNQCRECDTYIPTAKCEAPSPLFMINRSFLRRVATFVGLKKNHDWTTDKK
ncbi:radical SAM/SPASM domain-containing protein [Methanococcus voltae]|uniref:Radical SAM domain protein n=1 Tax=Methanococcus voltae (strain ATCC BAA-1334 / A3) TaxID=456320 RepID=D7DRY8_METV3|nr:radical SAM/SPASM domain-containing protein [Methanococcus voltae]MCS3901423.1 radical SAM protein with 4Fe4S-binding SPASM domain [Methanococcus voltae]